MSNFETASDVKHYIKYDLLDADAEGKKNFEGQELHAKIHKLQDVVSDLVALMYERYSLSEDELLSLGKSIHL